MKVATNLQQQQLKQQKKEEEPKEDKLDMIIKRIEALEKGRNKGGWNANQTQNRQNNKQPYYGKNKNTKFDKKVHCPLLEQRIQQQSQVYQGLLGTEDLQIGIEAMLG